MTEDDEARKCAALAATVCGVWLLPGFLCRLCAVSLSSGPKVVPARAVVAAVVVARVAYAMAR